MNGSVLLPAGGRARQAGICREFPGTPGQVGCVRDFVARRLRRHGCPGRELQEILVCVSELATNAIRYTRSRLPGGEELAESPCLPVAGRFDGRFLVTIRVTAPTVRIEVADAGPAAPSVLDVEDDNDAARGGRGFLLVSALSDAMGYQETDFGGIAWFEYNWYREADGDHQ